MNAASVIGGPGRRRFRNQWRTPRGPASAIGLLAGDGNAARGSEIPVASPVTVLVAVETVLSFWLVT